MDRVADAAARQVSALASASEPDVRPVTNNDLHPGTVERQPDVVMFSDQADRESQRCGCERSTRQKVQPWRDRRHCRACYGSGCSRAATGRGHGFRVKSPGVMKMMANWFYLVGSICFIVGTIINMIAR